MKTAKKTILSLVVLSLAFSLPATARADWDPVWSPDGTRIINHKMHYPQLPDLGPNGMDVLATWPSPFSVAAPLGKVLADDWRCTGSGPVTDIHIWGSWLENRLPHFETGMPGDPEAVTFKLSIHEDIPAVIEADTGLVLEHSRPGPLLKEFLFPPGSYTARPLDVGTILEWFYDPNQNEIVGVDNQVYQYNFFIDEAEAFDQKEGTIYWLDVIAQPLNPLQEQIAFGWKTSIDHWNDDAVYGDVLDPAGTPQEWYELRYPQDERLDSVLWGQSIDLAFVITPEPVTLLVLALGLIPVLLKRRRV